MASGLHILVGKKALGFETNGRDIEKNRWDINTNSREIETYDRDVEMYGRMTMVLEEEEKIERYIWGLPDSIQGNVTLVGPTRLQDAINLENSLMDQKVRVFTARQAENKRRSLTATTNQRSSHQWHYKSDYPKLKNQNHGNAASNGEAQGRVYALGGGEANQDPNVLTDTKYDIELADEKIIGVDTILRGCTLNFLNHPFNIDLMSIELGSFDVIIVQGDRSDSRSESRLNVISCTKTQKYLMKGFHIFLAHITKKKTNEKSEEKRLEDVPTMWDFLKVFPEDLPELLPSRLVEFHIDLVPGAAPVAQAPYRLAHSEMKDLSDQLQELSYKGFIRPTSSTSGDGYRCEFWIPRVQFLGHVIDSKGIHVDPSKIEFIKDWAAPKTPTEICQFLAQILNAQAEAIKEENVKEENLNGMNKEFDAVIVRLQHKVLQLPRQST
ncbi:hypothetical protein Tco_0973269 [Tanacetum coccineum]